MLCENLSKKAKYTKSFVIQLQNEYNGGKSVRSLSKKYKLSYETTRQLILRDIEEYYNNEYYKDLI